MYVYHMAKAKNKTVATDVAPDTLIATFDEQTQADVRELITIFESVTKEPCVLWGNIFGFGTYHYVYASGREGDFLSCGFAVRKSGIVIYTMMGHKSYPKILEKLGTYKDAGVSCLQIKRVADIHVPALKKLIVAGLKDLREEYPAE